MTIQRTAQGRTIDMATLAAKNEKVRAVGNMNVNARGDILDNNNNVINDNSNRVKNMYRNTVTPGKQTVPQLEPVKTGPLVADEVAEPVELTKEEAELFESEDEDDTK